MRELILTMTMSLDGFVCGPNGEADWIRDGDQEAMAWKLENLSNAGLHIMGSRTFRSMAAYWPTATGVFAPLMNQIPKAVFSRQGPAVLKAIGTPSGQPQPRAESWSEAYVASGSLADEIARLKSQDGKPIVAHGGAAFARSLIAEALVDQYRLVVHPLALGKGLPIFADLVSPARLKRIDSKTFPLGSEAQIYRPA
ncbi:MAG TPA: dihydrofolate reductase family protein [Mesorhizobium sp.]|jgi:dihydrofolate reductase|uniref:dihydrofolate reductase family protein n=1 Tax=Mesorhizobium sp. TaxID=1871066 RepID=UPI002DDD99F8|nr:dihydrofolate reductase family protein [Mesorhizobium sp.]HEV2503567.1 dihydrofolate reductase family protein [Mesorhizobium sp.]